MRTRRKTRKEQTGQRQFLGSCASSFLVHAKAQRRKEKTQRNSISWRAGLRAVACGDNRERRQSLSILRRRQRRCPMPVYFVQPLELRELLLRLILPLQPRVREKELIVNPWIFRVQFDTTSQQRHRL